MNPLAESAREVVGPPGGAEPLLVATVLVLTFATVGASVVDGYRRLDRRLMSVVAPWIYVLVPGIALHELAHAVVGARYADVSIDWTRPHVELDWRDDVPVWGVVATLFAPLVVGGFAAFALAFVVDVVAGPVAVWLAINWLLLAGPSVGDVVALLFLMESGS